MTIRDEVRDVVKAKEGIHGVRWHQVAAELPHLSKKQVTNALKQMRTKGFLGSVIDDEGARYFVNRERVVQCRPKEKREPAPEPYNTRPLEVAMGGWR